MKNINWCLAFSIYFTTLSTTANAAFAGMKGRFAEYIIENNLEIPFFILIFLIIGTIMYWAYISNKNNDDE